jgi:hypothetical protein
MSMDLSNVVNDHYFAEATNIERVFTYADITLPNRPNPSESDATAATDDVTTAVASEITELENIQKQE